MMIRDALGKLLNPEGCDEEFETGAGACLDFWVCSSRSRTPCAVFLGMHHYFMSWSLLLNRFRDAFDRYQSEPVAKRPQLTNRLIQVVTKWLRLNPQLRSARMSVCIYHEADGFFFLLCC